MASTSQVYVEGGESVVQIAIPMNESVPKLSNTLVGQKRKSTKPKSPLLRINKRLSINKRKNTLSSEEMEVINVEEEKKTVSLKLQQNRRKYQMLKTNGRSSISADAAMARSLKKLTVPVTPTSHLKKRMGSPKRPSVTSSAIKNKENAPPHPQSALKPTQVEPFHFETDKRFRTEKSKSDAVVPAAEFIAKYYQDPRSHHVPQNAAKSVTLPTSPQLQTKLRAKTAQKNRPLSHEEIIEKQMEEFEKNAFKAKPVNKKIFESMGESGVPKVEAKPSTEPMEFTLNINRRASVRESLVPQSEEPQESFSFKARPMPDFAQIEAPPSPRACAAPALTIPVSPKLVGGRRASSAPARRQKPHHSEVAKKKAAEEQALLQYLHAVPAANPTEPQEFHLATASRGEQHQAALRVRLEQEQAAEEAARKVVALSLPAAILARPEPLHAPAPKDVTEPAPFKLASEQRHLESQETLRKSLLSQEEQQRLLKAFKARPLPKTTFEEDRAIREKELERERERQKEQEQLLRASKSVVLESDLRAEKRREFDRSINERMNELALIQSQISEQRARQEEQQLKQLRRRSVAEGGLCFKAAPLPQPFADPFPLKMVRSAPTTDPLSPRLGGKRASLASLSMEEDKDRDRDALKGAGKEKEKEKEKDSSQSPRALGPKRTSSGLFSVSSEKDVPLLSKKQVTGKSAKGKKGLQPHRLTSSSVDGKEMGKEMRSSSPRCKRSMELAEAITML